MHFKTTYKLEEFILNAQNAMLTGSRILAILALELIEDSAFLETVKEEHRLAIGEKAILR